MQTSPTRRWTSLFLCGLLCALPPLPALAGPSGEVVVEGQAEFSRPDDQTTVIDTFTDTTIIEYDSFDILQGELVEINQPHSHSKAINHVPFGEMTQINGSLHSNGFVYIVNPAGIFLGDTAVVDVGGLVAAAGRISYDDFLAGEERFTELGGEVVVAEGAMVRADDTVALLGQRVANYGTIVSEGGMVAFIAGDEAVLGSLHGRTIVRVDGGDGGGDALPDDQFALTQAGSVDAGMGRVLLTAGDTYSLAMNHTGITRGREIELRAEQDGLVHVAGTLDASDTGGGEQGGSIHVTGEKIAVTDARIDASGDAGGGEIRIGGDVQGQGDLRTADRTYVSQDAELVADARRKGDGGSIVVWAEEKTGFYGSASARGGSRHAGDGGFIEISGRQSLDARGHHIDLSAPNGRTGTLLYDPARIEIRGGSSDGSDLPDPVAPDDPASVLDNGTAGRILSGTNGSNDPDDPLDPFVIYESEIEGTDANIILQATQEIYVDESFAFVNDDVVLMPTNSLIVQTTGDPFANGNMPTDGYAIDLGENLTWEVSEGGIIDIRTQFDDPGDTGVGADIRVGKLVWGGRAFVNNASDPSVQPGLLLADPLRSHPLNDFRYVNGTAVSIQAQVGDIVVGEIVADGADAAVVENADMQDELRLAEAGGDVRIGTQDGNVTVGPISSRGGNAYDAALEADRAPSRGGNGGTIQIDVGGGTATILGDLVADGGEGLAGGFRRDYLDAPVFPDGRGGRGGNIGVNADLLGAPGGSISVNGSLSADGGVGGGVLQPPGLPLTPETSQGGPSGSIRLVADQTIEVGGDPMAPIEITATGGDGLRGGGPPGVAPDQQANQQTVVIQSTGTDDEGLGFDVVLHDVEIDTSGGDALDGSNGASGGNSGSILISAGTGAVEAGDGVRIVANGGAGAAPSDPDGTSIRPGNGGGTLAISITGAAGVEVAEIESVGGAGHMGDGGVGGFVELSASAGNVVVGEVNVDGGDVETGPDGEVWLGGDAGSVRLDAGDTVQIGGQVRGFGGSGWDEDDMPTHAEGAIVALVGGTAIEALGPGASVQGGTISLNAPRIGGNGTPAIGLAGTLADDDTAFVSGSESIEVNLLDMHGPTAAETGSGLELLTISQSDETGESLVTASDVSDPVLVVSGAASAGENATIERMETGDDHPSLVFVLTAADDNDEPGLEIGTGALGTGAVSLGANGGIIRNQSGAIVADDSLAVDESHLTSTGNVVLEGTSIGEDGNAIRVAGDMDASLRLLATGDVHVDMFDAAAFGGLAVVQSVATATTLLQSLDAGGAAAMDPILLVEDVPDPDPDAVGPTVARLTAMTPTGTDLTYRHADPGTAAGEPTLQLHTVVLGGDGTFSSTGDLELTNPSGASVTLNTQGADLHLQAGVDVEVNGQLVDTDGSIVVTQRAGDPAHIVMEPGLGGDTADLVLEADGDVGGDEVLVTEGVERLAAGFDGDFRMRNGGGELRIEEVELAEFQVSEQDLDLVADADEVVFLGVRSGTAAGSDFELDNGPTDDIVLGEFTTVQNPNDGSFNATHVSVTGNADFLSPIRIDNAQTITLDDGDDETVDEMVMVNSARVAAGGDVLFSGDIDSAVPAMDDSEVSATFVVDAAGTTTYRGNVGAGQALARFDTSSSRFDGAGNGDPLEVQAEDVVFRGTLDGPSALTVTGTVVDPGLDPDDDDGTSISFGGNVGALEALGSLDATADAIDFAVDGGGSAEQVVVDDHLALSTQQGADVVPVVATITDTSGNLRIAAGGDVTLGDAMSFEKLTVVGELEIEAGGTVTVGDLSASRIRIDAPDIDVVTREAGFLQLPDGSLSQDQDGGVDWVANAIVTTTAPETIGAPGGPLSLYLGSGGVSIPGGLSGYRLSYANPDLSAVSGFIGEDGTVLDLTGDGPPVFGDPTRSVPSVTSPLLPEARPVFGSDAPAPASRVSGRQMLAFLRCSGLAPAARGSGCDAEDRAALDSVERFQDGPLATERAREITRRYGELLTEPGASERLRAAFASAGRAFGETVEWRHGELDGAAFYRFLASAPKQQQEALASMRELAWLFTQLELLGLTDDDTRRLQRLMAQEFADAAGLQGFDAAEVTAAVDASPIHAPDAPRP